MNDHSSVPFFIFLAFLVFAFITSRGKKKKPALSKPADANPAFSRPISQRPVLSKPSTKKVTVTKHHSAAAAKPSPLSYKDRQAAPVYEVHRKGMSSSLGEGWQKKRSLRRAFILSEVLKRNDERESKF